MSNLALLVLCFALGIALRRTGRLPEGAPAALNAVIINVALPALALAYIRDIEMTPALRGGADHAVRGGDAADDRRGDRRDGAQELDPPLITLMVGLGIPLSFVTLPVWHAVLARL
jgi:predicted permease